MMNDLVTQIVCGARWLDAEDSGWTQILVFIVMAVIYALGSIAKTKKVKTKEGEEPAKGGLAGESLNPPGKQQITKAGLPHTPRTGRRVIIQPVTDRQPAVVSTEVAQVQPAHTLSPPLGRQVIELAARTSSEKETKGVQIPSEVPVPAYLTEILSDYADPEKVRKVILHYEILGKPLSVREPPDNTIGS
jgi:hypothetical protein